MKIVHLSRAGARGGAGVAADRLSRQLSIMGHASVLLGLDAILDHVHPAGIQKTGAEESALASAAEELFARANRTALSNTAFTLGFEDHPVEAHPLVAEADILHLHWTSGMLSIPGIARLLALGKPVVWTLHDQWAFTGGCHYSAGCGGYRDSCRACPQLEKFSTELPAAMLRDKGALWPGTSNLTLVSPSRWMADCAQGSTLLRHQPVEVIANGLDLATFNPTHRTAGRSALGLPEKTLVVLFVAQNTSEHRKGLASVVAALQRLQADPRGAAALAGERLKFLAIGEAAQMPDTLPITFLPPSYSEPELARLYAAADVLLAPSLEDNLPNTVAEALACGTPAIAYQVGGVPEMIADNVTGRLLPIGETAALAGLLLQWAGAPELARAMRPACREFAAKRYDAEKNAPQMLALYSRLKGVPAESGAASRNFGPAGEAWMNAPQPALEGKTPKAATQGSAAYMLIRKEQHIRATEFEIRNKEHEIQQLHTAATERLETILKLDQEVTRLREVLQSVQPGSPSLTKTPADEEVLQLRARLMEARRQLQVSEAQLTRTERELAVFRPGATGIERASFPRRLLRRWQKSLAAKTAYPLARLRQYEPRPMRPEKFPAAPAPGKWPRICIITPSYQQAAFLERTMLSVLDQNYPNLAYGVQDGGSTDRSTDLITKHIARLAHAESAPDGGQADAIRRGFAKLYPERNDIMAWLNSDDVLMPGALRYVGAYFARHPEVDVVYGHRVVIDEEDREVGRWYMPAYHAHTLKWFDLVPQETLFWRTHCYQETGGIDSTFQFALDWDILARFEKSCFTIRRLPYFLGCFRVHREQKTSAKIQTVGEQEMDRIRRRIHDRGVLTGEIQQQLTAEIERSALVEWLHRRGVRR